MKLAVIYTCFNRKAKTINSIRSVIEAVDRYNKHPINDVLELSFYITDDGCTDGTPEAIKEQFATRDIHVLKGSGKLFWARGMCFSWDKARKLSNEWDGYLLMNDDTTINPRGFNELLEALDFSKKHYHQEGIISGITCSTTDPTIITYGGDIIPNKFNGRQIRLGRSSSPQMVDITNANIMLVPASVVDKIGIFYSGYEHGSADNDYSMMARRKGIPVLITASACGECDNDHGAADTNHQRIINMSLKERKAYYNHPLHSTNDYLTFVRRNMPIRYPLSWLFRMMLVYCPKLYFTINRRRKISK